MVKTNPTVVTNLLTRSATIYLAVVLAMPGVILPGFARTVLYVLLGFVLACPFSRLRQVAHFILARMSPRPFQNHDKVIVGEPSAQHFEDPTWSLLGVIVEEC
jgi:hypothetical protein